MDRRPLCIPKADRSGRKAALDSRREECKRAATDWRNAVQQGDVDNAIQFPCQSDR